MVLMDVHLIAAKRLINLKYHFLGCVSSQHYWTSRRSEIQPEHFASNSQVNRQI